MKKHQILILFCLLVAQALSGDSKTALIIGNGDYSHFSRLSNPTSEARDMRDALERLGFDVILVLDGTEDEIYDALDDFEARLRRNSGLALFHYGGHGVQVNGANYLIPVSAEIPDERRVKSRAIDVDEIVGAMAASGSKTNIIILDACRDNPLTGDSRSGSRGLAVVGNQPPDSIIVYSADAGTTAQDGLFTPTLLKYIETPGMEFYDVLKKVRTEVRTASGGKQRTGDYNQLESDIYLAGTAGSPVFQSEKVGFGSIRISVLEAGTIYFDGDHMGPIEANGSATLSALATGNHELEIRYRDETEVRSVTIREDDTIEVAFTYKSKVNAPILGENFVLVAGGTFQLGSNSGNDDEKPVHNVTVSDYYIGKYEVTQKEYEAVMGINPSDRNHGTGDNYPVNKVSWLKAIEYCNKLSELHGLTPCYSGRGRSLVCDFDANGYRLPTEAEWFFAARGGKFGSNTNYSGASMADAVSWYDNNSNNSVHPVGMKRANDLGIYDMSGNVSEWCWDFYGPYTSNFQTDPTGPETGSARVIRGGGWYNISTDGRISRRNKDSIAGKSFSLGFRVVRR